MSIAEAERQVLSGIEELTGFGHAVLFQSGTAALEAVITVFTAPHDTISLPALSCWTLSFAVTKLERAPRFVDVDAYWSGAADLSADLALLMDPWGGVADWRASTPREGPPVAVADMTLSPGGRLDGEPASSFCAAGVLSLGGGKPLGVGSGGVALFRDPAHAREARRLFRFGFDDGRWEERLERYVCPTVLFPALADRLERLPSSAEATESAATSRERLARMGLSSNELRPGGSWGRGNCLPVVLPTGFPLTPRDIEGVAVGEGLRLARHPVGPPYLERAWGTRPRGACHRAEALAPRTLFLYTEGSTLDALAALFDRLVAAPEMFRAPFPLPRPRGELPADLERLSREARLIRKLDGGYGLLEEANNLLWPIDDREAALVQSRQARA